jgi:CTP synthase (UTP-ammonia lyase)
MSTAIAALGDRDVSFLTHREIDAAMALEPRIRWVGTDSPDAARIDAFDGLWVLPGTPYRDDDAAIAAIRFARETDPDGETLVAAPLACSLVGQERTVVPVAGTRVAAICGTQPFTGFHFCGYGLAPGVVERLEAAGLVMGAHADDAGVEAFELPGHPFYVATLFQPQVGSSRAAVHPLLAALVQAATSAASAPRA